MADADDVLKTAGKLFGKLGGALQQVGGQVKDKAKQVTGLGRGDVKLELDHTRAAPGGTLTGRVTLALSEPVAAKAVKVTLRARQRVMTVGKTSSGRSVSTSHADVYQFEKELAGAQTRDVGVRPIRREHPVQVVQLVEACANRDLELLGERGIGRSGAVDDEMDARHRTHHLIGSHIAGIASTMKKAEIAEDDDA